ncbi:MAG: hypothetical protein ABI693_34530 [Bryobacteraceae bacterium]
MTFSETVGTAILGIDTLWGGDVMCASGTGRFIADSWFSDEPLPLAYTHPAAARIRESGGVTAAAPAHAAIDEYLSAVDVRGAIGVLNASDSEYVRNLGLCFEVMWDLAMELLGRGAPVPYERCVLASTGAPPEQSDPTSKRELLAELLQRGGHASVDEWRQARLVPMASVKALGAAVIAQFDALSEANVSPYLPAELRTVPRANITFLPIRDAWFSGSMNYLGRSRKADGSPLYEATYEINASLEISLPEIA